MSRAAKVERIAQAVRDGTYKIQVAWLADTILTEMAEYQVLDPHFPEGTRQVNIKFRVLDAESGDYNADNR